MNCADKFMRRISSLNSFLPVFMLLSVCTIASAQVVISPTDAVAMLKNGNERFVAGKLRQKDYTAEVRTTAAGQKPYAIVLSCADSRVSPEIIFDESIGKLFVVRVAGNVADPVTLGSIEYAAEHLNVPLIIVLGHESCGAVKATIEGGEVSPNIQELAHHIAPAVQTAKKSGVKDKDQLVALSVKNNVVLQAHEVAESKVIHEFLERKKLQIVGGVYNLHTGIIEWVDANKH